MTNAAPPIAKADLPRHYLMEDSKARTVPLLERKWYYSIEHAPGEWTSGMDFAPTAMTRRALQATGVEGQACVDLGSMDGLIPTVLARRGAKRVLSYDRLDFSEKMTFLQEKLNVGFEYRYGMSLRDFRDQHANDAGFDVGIFSGVAYHMFDPMAGLLLARSMVREGGIMIVETATVVSEEQAAFFNAEARFYPGDNYWLFSVANLDYLLRMARLAPLECFWIGQKARTSEHRICRLCVAARAVPDAPAAPGDDWVNLPQRYDFAEVIDWTKIAANKGPDVPYTPTQANLPLGPAGTVDLYKAVLATPESPRQPTRLALSDTW